MTDSRRNPRALHCVYKRETPEGHLERQMCAMIAYLDAVQMNSGQPHRVPVRADFSSVEFLSRHPEVAQQVAAFLRKQLDIFQSDNVRHGRLKERIRWTRVEFQNDPKGMFSTKRNKAILGAIEALLMAACCVGIYAAMSVLFASHLWVLGVLSAYGILFGALALSMGAEYLSDFIGRKQVKALVSDMEYFLNGYLAAPEKNSMSETDLRLQTPEFYVTEPHFESGYCAPIAIRFRDETPEGRFEREIARIIQSLEEHAGGQEFSEGRSTLDIVTYAPPGVHTSVGDLQCLRPEIARNIAGVLRQGLLDFQSCGEVLSAVPAYATVLGAMQDKLSSHAVLMSAAQRRLSRGIVGVFTGLILAGWAALLVAFPPSAIVASGMIANGIVGSYMMFGLGMMLTIAAVDGATRQSRQEGQSALKAITDAMNDYGTASLQRRQEALLPGPMHYGAGASGKGAPTAKGVTQLGSDKAITEAAIMAAQPYRQDRQAPPPAYTPS